jgi:hypothetical protein
MVITSASAWVMMAKVDAPDPPLEQRGAENEGQNGRHDDDGDERERQPFERHPEVRQSRELIPIHEVGDAGRRLDLGIGDARSFKLEEGGHAIAAKPEKQSLSEAENSSLSPTQYQADRDERIGQILADEIEPKNVENKRQR